MTAVSSRSHVFAWLVLLTACTESSLPLPPLPAIEYDGLQPAVEERLREAYTAVDADPSDPEANGELAMVLHVHDRFAAAALCYGRARMLAPGSFRWAYLQGDALEQAGRTDEALESFRHAHTLNPRDARVRVRIAGLLVRKGADDEARSLYEALLDEGAGRADVLYGFAQLLNQSGQPEAAIVLLEQLIRRHGNAGPAHYALSQAYRRHGDPVSAARHQQLFERYRDTRIPVDDPLLSAARQRRAGDQPHMERGAQLYKDGQLPAAAAEYERALEINPDNAAAHANLVAIDGAIAGPGQAREHYERAVALDPDLAIAYSNYGTVLLKAGQFAAAEPVLARAAALDTAGADALANLGFAIELQGRLSEAGPHYRQALQRDPGHALANYLLGRLLAGRGEHAAAIALLERSAAADSPHRTRALVSLADALRDSGQTDAGIESLKRARQFAAQAGNDGLAASLEREIQAWSAAGR